MNGKQQKAKKGMPLFRLHDKKATKRQKKRQAKIHKVISTKAKAIEFLFIRSFQVNFLLCSIYFYHTFFYLLPHPSAPSLSPPSSLSLSLICPLSFSCFISIFCNLFFMRHTHLFHCVYYTLHFCDNLEFPRFHKIQDPLSDDRI